MWKRKGELDLVRGDFGVASALEGSGDGGGPGAESGSGNAEGAHDGRSGGGDAMASLPESCW